MAFAHDQSKQGRNSDAVFVPQGRNGAFDSATEGDGLSKCRPIAKDAAEFYPGDAAHARNIPRKQPLNRPLHTFQCHRNHKTRVRDDAVMAAPTHSVSAMRTH